MIVNNDVSVIVQATNVVGYSQVLAQCARSMENWFFRSLRSQGCSKWSSISWKMLSALAFMMSLNGKNLNKRIGQTPGNSQPYFFSNVASNPFRVILNKFVVVLMTHLLSLSLSSELKMFTNEKWWFVRGRNFFFLNEVNSIKAPSSHLKRNFWANVDCEGWKQKGAFLQVEDTHSDGTFPESEGPPTKNQIISWGKATI